MAAFGRVHCWELASCEKLAHHDQQVKYDAMQFCVPSRTTPTVCSVDESYEIQTTTSFKASSKEAALVGIGSGSSGKRLGAGRKRIHEGSYKSVRSSLWKSISLDTNVYERWVRIRKERGFSNISDFASLLLINIESGNASDSSHHNPNYNNADKR